MSAEREYCFAITRDDEVVISTSESNPEWRLRPTRGGKGWSRPTHGDALLTDSSDHVRIAVRCLRRLPRPRYTLLAGEEVLGVVEASNIWRTRYRLVFADGRSCDFRMPMFSTRFIAASNESPVAHARMLREDVWAVLFEPGEDRIDLVAALARLLYARWHSE